MAFKQQPLKQEDYKMKIITDLGRTTATDASTNLARYAIFECTKCNTHFKARCGGLAAKKQETCNDCTKSKRNTYKHPLYAIWNGIKQRCYNPKRKDYRKYGAKGVTMCDDWKNDVESFFDWCINNGWKQELVIDKDIKSRELGISPAMYSPETITFITIQKNAEEANAKSVIQTSLNDDFIFEHISCVQAALSLGKPKTSKSSIANCCRGIQKTAFGFKWKYK